MDLIKTRGMRVLGHKKVNNEIIFGANAREISWARVKFSISRAFYQFGFGCGVNFHWTAIMSDQKIGLLDKQLQIVGGIPGKSFKRYILLVVILITIFLFYEIQGKFNTKIYWHKAHIVAVNNDIVNTVSVTKIL